MQTKTNVHNPIILDESGSMEVIKKYILKALEDMTKNIKNIAKENSQQQYLSLHTFNSSSINIHYNNTPIHVETAALKRHRYQPYNGTCLMTPLVMVFMSYKNKSTPVPHIKYW